MSDYAEPRDGVEALAQGAAAVITAGLVALALMAPASPPEPAMEAPKPTQVTLSVVEEPPPPPPPPAPAPPAPEPPPPLQAAPSPLPPPPPRPRHIVRPRHPSPPHAAPPQHTPEPERKPTLDYARIAQQAPESHSAEAAYIGRLHTLVARNTVPPAGAQYRLTHPEGEVQIGFTLARTGAVLAVYVIHSSGSALLDRQGVAIVAGLHYPAMPADVYPGEASHAFSVPVAFTWSGGSDDL